MKWLRKGGKMFPTYEEVINNIKILIEQKGMKQSVVANRAGLTAQDFSNILNKRRKLLRVEHLPAIANALGVEIQELFCLSNKEEVSDYDSPLYNEIRRGRE